MTKNSIPNNADSNPPDERDVREIPLHSLDMKQLIELDACTRCGECLTWCPVYDQDAKEAIIPRRKVIDFLKIAKAQHGLLAKIMKSEKLSAPLKAMLGHIMSYRQIGRKEIDDFVQNLYECSTCGQCEVVCPAHIETVALWEELRRVIVQAGYGPLEVQQALVKSVKAFDNPWQQPRAARTKWARKAKKDGLISNLPRDIKRTRGKVLLFFGCTAAYDVNVKQVAINTINILEALGIDYGILGSEEKCCASVLLRMGDPEHKRVFKENIDLFNSLGIETLISSCSGCFKTIMQDYPRIAPLNFEVLHSVEFFARMLKQEKLTFPYPVNRTVTYHDPCHLGRATGGFEAPRMIMEAIPGLELVEMPRNREYSRCCGAGGGLKAGFPDIQTKMAQKRVEEAEETGAENLVSCCPFCYQGLNVGITALESQIVMRDISALVAEALIGYDVFERAAEKAASKAEDKKARQTARREARALKKQAARQVPETENSPKPHKSETGDVTAGSPPETQSTAEIDSKALKKAERERKRAEKRAARSRDKATRRKSRESAADQAPGEAGELAGKPQMETVSDGAELKTTDKKSVTETATSDSKSDRERKRAEKRAAREKEKAARRATRSGEKAPERKNRETTADPTSAEAGEYAEMAPTDPVSDGADLKTTEKKSANETATTDSKTERERKRAEKRAAREKEKAARKAARSGDKVSRKKDRETSADPTRAEAGESAEMAPADPVSDGASDFRPAEKKSANDTATTDSKTERERRRAEKRAAREKEKAARKAAREKQKAADQ